MKKAKLKSKKYSTLSRRQFMVAAALAIPISGGCSSIPQTTFAAPTTIRQDWHMHTNRAGGKPDMNVHDMILTNQAYGLKLMGISEHIDRLDQREDFKEKIRLNRTEAATVPTTNMRVMIGTETTMINPKLCSLSAELATMLDYRLVSCNHYHLKHVENATPATANAYAGHYLDMLHGAMDLGFADTIGHPFYHQKLHKKYGPELLHATLKAYDDTRLTETLQRAAKVNMAFEINPRHADLALDWFKELVQEARLHGTKFTIGTDAHAIKSLGYPEGTSGRTSQDVLKDLTITDKDLKWKPIKFRG